ncbi:MAG TPA: methylmalonyl Co-A mutase-associated GTPase MeaB [Gammaproteobacteria bacterium]
MTAAARALDPAALFAGDRRALARALTAVENETPDGLALLRALDGRLGRARVIGITGPPGAGKSTLIGACLAELLRRDRRAAVVAVDPSSPLTGGAILGDRIRMEAPAADARVFVRSLASRGHLGGLSRSTAWVVDVLDAAGWDVVIVETVGTGQSEIEIVDLAEQRVVVCAPGLGDDVQALKAGVLEIADLFVVNKWDLPLAAQTATQLRGALHLSNRDVEVLGVSSTRGDGVVELVDRLLAGGPASARARDPERRLRHLLAELAAERLRRQLRDDLSPRMAALCAAVRGGGLTLEAAAEQLLATATG